ncbi:MAG: hypothetical protein K2G28_01475 [Acetatifactor sp.]|nr:hypothetical protein [Acetatifactor sp.]
MTKGVKKKSRRLKTSIRKTLGTLFLISALIVAAIPTENLRAEGENPLADNYWVRWEKRAVFRRSQRMTKYTVPETVYLNSRM